MNRGSLDRASLDHVVWNSSTREYDFNAALWWSKAKLHLQKILSSKLNFIFMFNLKSKLNLDSSSL